MTPEWIKLRDTKNKAVYRLHMLEQYIGYIRKYFDQHTVSRHLEEVGAHNELKWSIHKLLYHDVDNKECINLLISCAEEITTQKLDPAIKEYEEQMELYNINKL